MRPCLKQALALQPIGAWVQAAKLDVHDGEALSHVNPTQQLTT